MNASSWHVLLERVRAALPELLEEFLEELDLHEAYANELVTRDDLSRTALLAFELFLSRLESGGEEELSPDFADALGRRRARQGLRVDQFTEAVRINFRLLWRALNRAAQPDLTGELIANGERVLNVVERYATEVQRAFLDETQNMAQQQRTARDRALSVLFAERSAPEDVAEAAELLGLRVDDTFELLALDASAFNERQRGFVLTEGALAHEDGALTFVFRTRGNRGWERSDAPIDGAHLARVRGAARLAPAARLARRLATANEQAGLCTLRDGLHLLVSDAVAGVVDGFEHELVGGLGEATPEDQLRFFTTIQSFMNTGSIQATADELFVHRNTVFKRLRAFQELTGLDVAVPRDAAIAVLMLRRPGSGVSVHTQRREESAPRH